MQNAGVCHEDGQLDFYGFDKYPGWRDYHVDAARELAQVEEPVSLEELSMVLSDKKPSENWEIRLHHSTLPKLEDLGCIEYDAEDNMVYDVEEEYLEQLTEFVEDLKFSKN